MQGMAGLRTASKNGNIFAKETTTGDLAHKLFLVVLYS